MKLAGYEFFMLDTIFLCHLWGVVQTRNHTEKRRSEAFTNTRLFNTYYYRDLSVKYDVDMSTVFKKWAKRNMVFETKPKMDVALWKNETIAASDPKWRKSVTKIPHPKLLTGGKKPIDYLSNALKRIHSKMRKNKV